MYPGGVLSPFLHLTFLYHFDRLAVPGALVGLQEGPGGGCGGASEDINPEEGLGPVDAHLQVRVKGVCFLSGVPHVTVRISPPGGGLGGDDFGSSQWRN